jgi:ribosomal RNA-processing protein 1
MRDGWAIESCNEWNSMLMQQGGPLWWVLNDNPNTSVSHELSSTDDIRIPAGLTFHLVDIYLEELEKILPEATAAPLPTLVHPFLILLARTPNKSIRAHIQSEFLNPLLKALQPKSSQPPPHKRARVENESPSYENITANACVMNSVEGCKANVDVVREGLLQKLLEISEQQETKTANRKLILSTCKEYGDVSKEKEEYATTS